jgi:enamine deaminase RidA (YjgF/YER057c/UK114 family)
MKRVNPASLAKPSGFSHATVATGTTVFLAGQTAWNVSGAIVDGGLVAQFEKALTNLLTALAGLGRPSARPGLDDGLHRRHGRLPGPGRGRSARCGRRLVGTEYPAMAGIGVSRLWDAEALVEVQGSRCCLSTGRSGGFWENSQGIEEFVGLMGPGLRPWVTPPNERRTSQ